MLLRHHALRYAREAAEFRARRAGQLFKLRNHSFSKGGRAFSKSSHNCVLCSSTSMRQPICKLQDANFIAAATSASEIQSILVRGWSPARRRSYSFSPASHIAAPDFLDRERTIAPPDYNRFHTVPGGILVTLSIGSVYAWSTFNGPLTRALGVVTSSGQDWSLGEVVPIFSLCAVTLGVTTTTLGPWAEKAGPRKVAMTAAVAWSSGLMISAAGVTAHSLPLLYLGYGVLGGIGWGFGYISPVSNLMKWFPDRRGLATGMALASFGGGAILAAPLNKMLTDHFSELPTYIGPVESVETITSDGKLFVESASGDMQEVVVASVNDLANLFPSADAGVYLVGTGDSGAMGCFVALGALHFAAMSVGALTMRVPADEWTPEGWTPPSEEENKASVNVRSLGVVDHNAALKTPQFWLMWAAVFGNAIAGVSIISCAKTMMGEVFGAALPTVVTGGFATGYVASLSAANGGGRFAWATISDFIGRKQSYFVFGLGIPVAVSIPYVTGMVASSGGMVPLYLFYGGTFLVVSFYGGLFSVLPAFIADTFGIKHAGAIHGRLLTAWAASALVGPSILTSLRGNSYMQACIDLAAQCNPELFQQKFGASIDELQSLVDAKTVTIARLLEILPQGTVDPTPAIYDSTMYTMAGIMGCALVCNAMIHPFPIDSPHFSKGEDEINLSGKTVE